MSKIFSFLSAQAKAPEGKPEEPNWPLLGAIRFFLAIVIFNEHTRLVEGDRFLSELFGGGAVAAFFIISGFSMAHSLAKGSKGFYERRFYRIWPLYIFSIALALVPMLRGEGAYAWPGGGAVELPSRRNLILNALMLQPGIGWPIMTNGVVWSLGVEAAYYVVVPFFARLSDRARLGHVFASLAFAFWAMRHSMIPIQNRGSFWPYLGMFWLFALGFELFRRRSDPRFQQGTLVAPMIVGLGSITMAVSLLLFLHQSKIKLSAPWQRVCLYLGELSYPLYILHDPVMAILNQAAPKTPIWAYYIAGLLAAIAAYHLLDAPLRRWHRKRQKALGERASQVPVVSMPAP